MAVNKNFVVKNGLEVNTNLLVADLDTQTVGIGTTIAPHELHVVGGIGVTNLNVTGVATIANLRIGGISTFVGFTTFLDDINVGGASTFTGLVDINGGGQANTFKVEDLTDNRVVIAGTGGELEDDGNFTFTGNQLTLGVGATVGGGLTASSVRVEDLTNNRVVIAGTDGELEDDANFTFDGNQLTLGVGATVGGGLTASSVMVEDLTNNRVVIAGTDGELEDDGNFTFTGNQLTLGVGATVGGGLTASSVMVEDLTNNRVVIAGTDGELEDSSNFVFDGSQLILGVGATVGGGLTVAGVTDLNSTLDVSGNVSLGSSLDVTGLTELADVNVSAAMTVAGNVSLGSSLDVTGLTELGDVNVSAGSTFGGLVDINAGGQANTFKVEDLTDNRVVLAGTGGELEDSGNLTFDGAQLVVTGVATVSGAMTAGSFSVGNNQVISSARQLQNIASLDSTTTATIESAIANAPNTFTDIEVTGIATFKSTVKVEDLAPNRVVFVGAGDSLTDDANFTFDRSQLILGVGATVGGALTVAGGINVDTIRGATNDSNVAFGALASNGSHVISLTLKPSRLAHFDGGVGIADSIFHIGDDNTQIRFPAADTVTVETAGSERVRVTDDGAIVTGIATIVSTTAADSNNKYNFVVRGDDSGTDDESAQIFLGATSTTTRGTAIAAQRKSSSNDHDLIFKTSDTSAVPVERVRISNVGRVGIGTVNPLDELHVNSSSTNVNLRLTRDVDNGARISGSDGASPAFIVETIASGTPTERFRVTSAGDVEFKGNNGITSMSFDRSSNSLDFVDGAKAQFGTGNDLEIYHDGTNSVIGNTTGNLYVLDDNAIILGSNSGTETYLKGVKDGAVEIYYDAAKKFETTSDGVIVTGIGTFDSTKHISIPVGTTAERSAQVANGMIRYNTTLNSYEGYGNGAWGGLGGGTEIDTTVSTTNPTGVGSFAAASYRSAMVRLQINQLNTDYQVGRYMLIHDGTTVTVLEEAAVSTGSTMVGSITGVIDGSNVELRVTLASAGVSTVTTIFDKITV